MIAGAATAQRASGRFSLVAGAILALAFMPNAASAQEMSDAQAVSAFQTMQGSVAVLTHQSPRLQDVRLAISTDCHDKAATGMSAAVEAQYCYCAAIVTVSLWSENEDMRARLSRFAETKGDPHEFLSYQGPELYAPFCHKVVAGMAAASH